MLELYVDPGTLEVRRRDLLVRDLLEAIRGARLHGIRIRMSLHLLGYRPLTGVKSQLETLPQTGLASTPVTRTDRAGMRKVIWQPPRPGVRTVKQWPPGAPTGDSEACPRMGRCMTVRGVPVTRISPPLKGMRKVLGMLVAAEGAVLSIMMTVQGLAGDQGPPRSGGLRR